MKNVNKNGFTLIELMIVVAIIGILAAVAVPQYSSYIEKSEGASVGTSHRNFHTTIVGCIQLGLDCDETKTILENDVNTTTIPNLAKDLAISIIFENSRCKYEAVYTNLGVLSKNITDKNVSEAGSCLVWNN